MENEEEPDSRMPNTDLRNQTRILLCSSLSSAINRGRRCLPNGVITPGIPGQWAAIEAHNRDLANDNMSIMKFEQVRGVSMARFRALVRQGLQVIRELGNRLHGRPFPIMVFVPNWLMRVILSTPFANFAAELNIRWTVGNCCIPNTRERLLLVTEKSDEELVTFLTQLPYELVHLSGNHWARNWASIQSPFGGRDMFAFDRNTLLLEYPHVQGSTPFGRCAEYGPRIPADFWPQPTVAWSVNNAGQPFDGREAAGRAAVSQSAGVAAASGGSSTSFTDDVIFTAYDDVPLFCESTTLAAAENIGSDDEDVVQLEADDRSPTVAAGTVEEGRGLATGGGGQGLAAGGAGACADDSVPIGQRCGVCFGSLAPSPKMLPCGHTFCKQCTSQLISGAEQYGDARANSSYVSRAERARILQRKDVRFVKCPICRERSDVPKSGDFPANYAVKELLEAQETERLQMEFAWEDKKQLLEEEMEANWKRKKNRSKSAKSARHFWLTLKSGDKQLCASCCLRKHQAHKCTNEVELLQNQQNCLHDIGRLQEEALRLTQTVAANNAQFLELQTQFSAAIAQCNANAMTDITALLEARVLLPTADLDMRELTAYLTNELISNAANSQETALEVLRAALHRLQSESGASNASAE